jgi:tRNA pseudouridine55 synthase
MRTAPAARLAKRPVHGVLLLDKPRGLSSNDALQRARRLYRAEKAGHTGTLDPLASGLLPVCFGAATKFAQVGLDAAKVYDATLALGVRTRTDDAEGEVLERRPVAPYDAGRLRAVLDRFVGRIAQVPPVYSALKRDGRPAYDYARSGEALQLAPREVQVDAIEILALSPIETPAVRVFCSKGTYIRALARDIGEALGCGAHLAALRRVASGPLSLDAAHDFDALQALAARAAHETDDAPALARLDRLLLPPDALLADAPQVVLDDAREAERFASGLPRPTQAADAACVRVYGRPGAAAALQFLGSGRIAAGRLLPQRLLSADELQQTAASIAEPGARPDPPASANPEARP